MAGPAWLTAQPLAHRGLHDASAGVIENTASAFSAAIAGGYGIETDLQISADGEAIKRARFKTSTDRILTLGELCDLVGGGATLVLELKSHFDGDRRLVQRCAHVLANYPGPVAVMSFDPAMIEEAHWIAPHLTRGIVAERHYAHREWDRFSRAEKGNMAFLLHANRTRPQFIAYGVKDLPGLAPLIARLCFRLPLLTWTVRTEEDRRRAERWADQMIFEGFRP
jgi:glycerophosphoryl diester phosphodiesterase